MPDAAYVEVEQVPADRLARVGGDGRRVADECAAVETERLLAAAACEHYVLVAAGVGPDDLGSGRDSHVRRIEQVIFNRDGAIRPGRAGDDSHSASHARAVDAADVVADVSSVGESEFKRFAV